MIYGHTLTYPDIDMVTDNLNLLVIDNNKAEILILTKAFIEQSIPVTVDWMDSGHKAIAAFISSAVREMPDIILVDYRLNGINGLDVVKVLSQNDRLMHIPIILISGMMTDLLRESAKSHGASDGIDRPRDYNGYIAMAAFLRSLSTKVKTERFAKP